MFSFTRRVYFAIDAGKFWIPVKYIRSIPVTCYLLVFLVYLNVCYVLRVTWLFLPNMSNNKLMFVFFVLSHLYHTFIMSLLNGVALPQNRFKSGKLLINNMFVEPCLLLTVKLTLHASKWWPLQEPLCNMIHVSKSCVAMFPFTKYYSCGVKRNLCEHLPTNSPRSHCQWIAHCNPL